jgi:uncharacterized protein YndB with AHSA1/START domain
MKLTECTVSRTMSATPGEVFDVWLDTKSPGGPWFGAERVILQPVVDGLFYSAIRSEGRLWPHYGRFVVIDRGHTIEHTWVSEATRGIESIVTVTFEARGEDTLVTLRHTNVPDDEMGRRHHEGWSFVLGAIAARFAS